jgi:hypothetical protein
MPPKAVPEAAPIAQAKGRAKAKAKPKAKAEAGPPRDVYDDLPRDLRATAKQMDRIEERRGRRKLVEVLERIAEAVERPAAGAGGGVPNAPRGPNALAAIQPHLARVRELREQMGR